MNIVRGVLSLVTRMRYLIVNIVKMSSTQLFEIHVNVCSGVGNNLEVRNIKLSVYLPKFYLTGGCWKYLIGSFPSRLEFLMQYFF